MPSSNESLSNTANPTSSSNSVCSHARTCQNLTTITDEHLIPIDELCKQLHTRLDTGLSTKQAKKVLKNNGENLFEIPSLKVTSSFVEKLSPSSRRKKSDSKKFTRSEWERLVTHRIPIEVHVIRDGTRTKILGKDLVVGDIVILSKNDIVPADIRLIDSKDLIVDNRLITGKQGEARTHEVSHVDCLLSPNMVFSCTNLLQGKCAGVVLRTGEDTVFGSLKNFAKRVRFAALR